MRILSVTQSYWPFLEFGGPPVKVRALAHGLAARGNSVTVLTADWGFEKRTSAQQLSTERSPFGWRLIEDGATAIYLPTWFRYRSLSWNPAVKRFARAKLNDFDVVHIYGLYDLLGPAVAKACWSRGIPYVIEPIGMYVPIVRNLWLKRGYHALYGRKLFSQASAVIATSDQEVNELAQGGVARQKIRLRRNGVGAPASWPERGLFRGKMGIADHTKLILFLGRLSKKKSPDLLLQAFATGNDSKNERALVFAGPDEGMESELRKMANELGVKARVKFAGPIFGEEKWSAYRDADVFVLPSQNENFGNTAAESVAAGTPVVVTDRCGIAPLLANVAGLVVPHEPAALAAGIARALDDAELRAQLKVGCQKVTASLGWGAPVSEMDTLYNELAKERRASAES